jgi:hypothetical protein
VVALDRAFKCAGMWLIPMKNIVNKKSAHLQIVNHTQGTLNIVPSKISWLETGDKFTSFGVKQKAPPKSKTRRNSSAEIKQTVSKRKPASLVKPNKVVTEQIATAIDQTQSGLGCLSISGCLFWTIVIAAILNLLGILSE